MDRLPVSAPWVQKLPGQEGVPDMPGEGLGACRGPGWTLATSGPLPVPPPVERILAKIWSPCQRLDPQDEIQWTIEYERNMADLERLDWAIELEETMEQERNLADLERQRWELEVEQTIEQDMELADLERQVPLEAGLQPKDSQKETCTVFVSNLSYHMADPEARLRDVFGSCGEVAEVRPIFTNKGAFRGYSYVEFRDEGSALRAFLLDRTVVDGRPMFVSPYVDKGKNPDFKVFKYSTALERHKLFISGLPFSCTKEDLEVICKAHGNVRDIRLVTNRAGTPKGLAYVEFEDEAQASQAVLKLDGLAIGEHVIKVAISNPPARRFPERPEGVGNPSQGQDPRQASGSRRKGRTQLSMVPRALQRQSSSTASAKNSLAQNPPAAPSPSAGEPKKMSNADFAKLLQNK